MSRFYGSTSSVKEVGEGFDEAIDEALALTFEDDWGHDPNEYSDQYEGLTILDHPHIDSNGSISGMPLYNHE